MARLYCGPEINTNAVELGPTIMPQSLGKNGQPSGAITIQPLM